ncbi:MAG TPA: ABC transporter permease [Dehalococcoidales bacterium]|nr:ABC transporter permease [Dehalococcoidales bacterium]
MGTYIVKRLAQALLVVIIVTAILFLAMRLLPGDPIRIYIQEQDYLSLTPEREAALRAEFGLDKPLPLQYIEWMSNLFRGDFGISIHYRESVATLFADRIPVTLHLGTLAFIIGNILGVLFGLIAALRRGTWIDTTVTSLANIGIAAPNFWLSVLAIYLFGLKLGWLPIFGYTSPLEDLWLSTSQLVMPVAVLASFTVAFIARQTRSSILEVSRQDYVRTAWSKGLQERVIVLRHMLKNGIIPIVTVMGVGLANLVGGSMIIENVFAIPGMGRLLVFSVFGQDYQVVQGAVLIVSVLVVMVNLCVDILYGWLDPRIRYD